MEAYAFGSQPFGYFGSQPLGYYVAGEEIFDELQQQYGARLEAMNRLSKLTFRAALATYLCQLEVWKNTSDTIPENLIDEAMKSVNSHIWEQDPEVCYYIQAGAELNTDRIESLLEALNAQLRHDRVLDSEQQRQTTAVDVAGGDS